MTHAIMILALSMGLAASPQSTTQVAANTVTAGGASRATPSTSHARPAVPEKTYCTSGTISGSRIVKQECKTKSEWAKDGVDIDDLMNSDQN